MPLIENWSEKFQNKEKQIRERNKTELSQSLVTNDGINHGKITVAGLNAIRNNTLNTYTPINDEEKKTIEAFNNSPVKIKDSSGKEYTVTYKDYIAFNNAQKGNLGNDWLPITYPASNKEKEGQIAGYYNKNTGKQYTLDDINSIVSSGVISPEGVKVLTDYGNSENKYQKEKAAIEYANGVPEKYGYNAFDFDEKDLEEWAKKNNYVYAEEYSYNGGKMGKKLIPIGEVTEQQKKDGQVLMAVVENNRALKSSKTDWGALAAGTHGFLDAATFGILPALTEWGSKSQYESAGLNPEYRVTNTESMGKTMAEHQTAGIVGSIAGGLATSIGVASGISAGLAKAGWAVGTAPIARGAVVQGITGVLRGGTNTAAQGGDWGDIGINALREGLTGAAGGAVGGIAEKGLTKLLTNSKYAASTLGKLKDLKFTAYGVNALGGVADALADFGTDELFVTVANNLFGANAEHRTRGDVLTDFAVSLVLGTAMNMKANSNANVQARVDDIVTRYGAEYMKYSGEIDGADADTRIKAGEEFIKTTENFKKEINESLFPGHAKEVEDMHSMIDTAIESTKMDIENAKNTETPVKATPSTEVSTPTAKSTTATPVSTEGGVITSASKSIDNIVNGTGTNKDYDLFKVGQVENRKAFEDATGIKLPATNSETRNFLRDFANKTPVERVLSDIPEAQRNSIIETANKIDLEGTGKTTEQVVAEVKGISDNVSATIKNQFGIDVDKGRLLEINLKALADNPENIITPDFVKGYSEVIGEKLKGINPKTLENYYFGKAPLGGKLADYGNKFMTVVDSSAQTLKANIEIVNTKVVVDAKNDNTFKIMPKTNAESMSKNGKTFVKTLDFLPLEKTPSGNIKNSISQPAAKLVDEIALTYKNSGLFDANKAHKLFEMLWENSKIENSVDIDGALNYLKTTKLYISPQDKADITDYNDFRKKYFNKLNSTTRRGKTAIDVDVAFMGFNDMYPGLVDASLTHPADQLRAFADFIDTAKSKKQLSLDDYYGQKSENIKMELEGELYNRLIRHLENVEPKQIFDIKAFDIEPDEITSDVAIEFLNVPENYTVKRSTLGGKDVWTIKPNNRYSSKDRSILNESLKQLGGRFSKATLGWNFDYDPTVTDAQTAYYNHLRTASTKSKTEHEALADMVFDKYGDKTPTEKLSTVAAEIADPVYGTDKDVNAIASVFVGAESGAYRTKKDLQLQENTLTKSLKPTDVQKKHIDLIAKGEEDISEVNPFLQMNKFGELIDVKRQLYDLENNAKVKFRKQTMADYYSVIDEVIKDADKWKDKTMGLQWEINTAERNAYDTMGKDAEKFIKTFIEPMKVNDRFKIDYINGIKQRILDMKLTDEEFELAQKYGEGLIDNAPDRIKQADAMFRDIAEQMKNDVNAVLVLNGYKSIDNPKITLNDKQLRTALDVLDGKTSIDDVQSDTIRQFVTLAKRNGMDSVNYNGKGQMTATVKIPYYPHGDAAKGFKNALDLIGMGEYVSSLPGDIAGRTEEFSPNKKWVGNLEKRKGPTTDYDISLWDGYINNVAEVIYHTSDITKLRMLETSLRRKFSNEGLQAKIKEAEQTMSPEELNVFLEGLDRKGITKHNNLINWVHEYANIIAGKQSHWDRTWEKDIGRDMLNRFDKAANIWAKNQTAANVSSVLNQYIQTTNILADNNPKDVMTAIGDIVSKKANLAESDFLTTRNGALRLKKSGVEKATDMLFWAAQKSDEFVSAVAYQTRYNEVKRAGGTDAEAKAAGDKYAGDIMADRSRIGRPTIFAARNPIMRMFTTFQIDNINSFMHFFKDIPRNTKAKGGGNLAVFKTMLITTLLTSLFNYGKEEVTGTKAATFDVVDLGADLYKYFSGDIDTDTLKESAIEQASRLPFASVALTATGVENVDRLPVVGTFQKIRGGHPEEIISLVNPVGGYNQAKKIVQGIGAVNKGVETDKSGNVMYPIEQTPGNYVRGALFGKYALPESQEYWDNERRPLGEEQTKEFYRRVEKGENPQAVYNDIYSAKEERARQKAESDAYYNKVDSLVKPISEDLSYNVDELYNSYSTEYAATHGGDKPTGIKVPKASKEFKRNKKTYLLTEEQCAELQNMYNTAYVDKVTPILNNNNLSNKQKYNRISDVRKGIRESVERKFYTKYSGKLTKK